MFIAMSKIQSIFVVAVLLLLFSNICVFAQEDSLRCRVAVQCQNQAYDKAFATMQLLIKQDRQQADYYAQLARLQMQMGDLTEAWKSIAQAEKISHGSGCMVAAELAVFQDSLGDAKSWLVELRNTRYRKYYHELMAYPLLRGVVGQMNEASEFDEAELSYGKVLGFLSSKQYGQALALCRQLQQADEDDHYALYLEARTLFLMQNYHDANKILEKAVAIYSALPAYHELGLRIAWKLHNYEQGMRAIRRIKRYQPFYANYLLWYARIQYAGENYGKATEAIGQYRACFPDDHEAAVLYVDILQTEGKTLSALRAINSLLREHRGEPQLFRQRGELYMNTKSWKFAEQDFGMALDLQPDNAEIWVLKGQARWQLGDKEGACSDWKWGQYYGSREATRLLLERCQ